MPSLALTQLRNQALALTEAERAQLAHDLVASLDGPAEPGASEAWAAEIQRRLGAVEDGTAQYVEADEVSKRIHAHLRAS